jgi:outer membrane protein assembly factor BamB
MKKFGTISLLIVFFFILSDDLSFSQSSPPWPMFRHDKQHSGRCANIGPTIGGLKWLYSADNDILSSPTVDSNGILYFGTAEWAVWAVNSDGSPKWSFYTGANVYSTPSIRSDGNIFVGSTDGYIYAINQDYGTEVWKYYTGAPIVSSPVCDEAYGKVYVGSTNNVLFAFGPSTFGFLALNWTQNLGGAIESTPAISNDGNVYVGTNDGKVYDYTKTGGFGWSTINTGGAIKSSVAFNISGSSMYFGNDIGYFYFGGPTGLLYWSYYTGGSIKSSPAVDSNGNVRWLEQREIFCFWESIHIIMDLSSS